jgi:hypothetical protein
MNALLAACGFNIRKFLLGRALAKWRGAAALILTGLWK